MRRALELAALGAGETNPNPVVGCVVVKNGRVIGEAFHRRAGGEHAEVLALEAAGPAARGATLYVNLEPCSHFGRTPPCAPRVAAAGVRRVVAAMLDPNPQVSGRGFAILRKARIEVARGVLEGEALLLNERFVIAARRPRPFVLLKAAITLDGRIATARGDSRWITSSAQRRQARRLRRLHDAVLVGIGTVLADDPLLLPLPRTRRPFYRVILDSRLRIPLVSRLVQTARTAPVWLLTRGARPRKARLLEARGVSVLRVTGGRGRVPLRAALALLRQKGLTSVMVEGGSEVLGSFLAEGLFDQVALFRAPLLLGGRASLGAFGGADPRRIAQARRMRPWSPLLRRGAANPGLSEQAHGGLYELWYPDG